MKKLFYQDTHIIDFEATVTDCVTEKERFRVSLDQTAFFPEEGGQGADRGTLAGFPVLDVQIVQGEIWHYIDSPLSSGSAVTGHVDWEQRFDYMQQHSGEHIISGLVHSRYGYDNVGFHLGKEDVTLDFNGSLTLSELREIESEANRIIWQDLPVIATFLDNEQLAQIEYRSKLELTEDVRIVEIPGVDSCACCAPHVDTTGQIGLLKVTGVQSHRGGVRITILCGARAVKAFNIHQENISAISNLLSAKQDAVADAVLHLKEENQRMKLRANQLQARLLALQTSMLPPAESQRNVLLFTGELDAIALRNTVNSLCEKYSGYVCLFSGDDSAGYRYIIGSNSLDCRQISALLHTRFGAKGGGSAPMVQGSIQANANDISIALHIPMI